MFSLKTTLLSLLVTQAPALIMHEPAPGGAYNAIITDGLAEFTWTAEEGDPALITLNLYNPVTLDTFQVGKDVPVADGAYTVKMEECRGASGIAWMRRNPSDDVAEVLASSPFFTVFGDVPPTTGVVAGAFRPTDRGYRFGLGIVFAKARRCVRKRREQRRVQLPTTVDDEIKEVGTKN
ncbi:hypothetical protein BDZ89DRAFT_1142269 [Hymenopellis radicata]|nr:hypothetical protein BDZ89DRAFT_1142269 [Hymenopellis radicata]